MAKAERKSVGSPDETRIFNHGHIDLVKIGGGTVGRSTFQPGWRWSEHVKSIAKTETCQVAHFVYQLSGRMGVKMDDGQEFEVGPGDVAFVPPGHDAWVIGDEAAVAVDWQGATNYASG